MQAQPEHRVSERFSHESIIKLEEDLTLSPYYAVSYNTSEAGMYLKSHFELYPGAHIRIRIDDYAFGQNSVPAKVVWCKKLVNSAVFRYGVGVEFLQMEKSFGSKAYMPSSSRRKTPSGNEREVLTKM